MSKKKIQEDDGATLAAPSTDHEVSSQDQKIQDGVRITIDSEENALAFYRQANYKAPEGINFCYVTSDHNVFWPENGSSASNHAFKKGLKIFRIQL